MASCPLSVILVCACAALAGEIAAGRQIEVTPDDVRAPLHDILFRHNSTPAPRHHVPIQNPVHAGMEQAQQRSSTCEPGRMEVGCSCQYNSDCKSHLCCQLVYLYKRFCKPRSKIGEACVADSRANRPYDYYCPCLKGYCQALPSGSFCIMADGKCVQ
ncbi:uncharacterized protein LOC142558173 [Dermacentor variabilis]|uniref:uncharacterized protein LOC142558173 n=1 Tax=Dermacentor variabilis TaxID=34621 RepID=UPI003F5C0D64